LESERSGRDGRRATTILPELRLEVGGFEAHCSRFIFWGRAVDPRFTMAIIGMDVLDQAKTITIDSQAMRITLARPDS